MRTRNRMAALAFALAGACGLMPPEEEGGSAGAPAPAPAPPPSRVALPPAGYGLVFEDEFQGNALGPAWNAHEEPRIDAFSTADAIDVSGGVLTIRTYTGTDGLHRTGFLTTEGNVEAVYGYFEARIRFSSAPGNWCAFWLATATIGDPLGDPGTAGVEIDVVEHRVTDQGGFDALRDMVALNLNWDGYEEHKKNVQRVIPLPDGSPVQGTWHVYGVLWTPTGYTFYVDGLPLWTTAAAISNVAEDVRLTCEVDDGGWAGFVPAAGYGTRATTAARMDVDWVRVWQTAPRASAGVATAGGAAVATEPEPG